MALENHHFIMLRHDYKVKNGQALYGTTHDCLHNRAALKFRNKKSGFHRPIQGKQTMRYSCIFIAICLCSISAPAVTGAVLGTGLDKLAVYAGTWKTETGHFMTLFSKAGKDSAAIKNDCWRSGDYYICGQYVNGKSKDLLVYTYDSKDGTYTIYPIVAGDQNVQPAKLIIHGNVWTYPWETNDKGKRTYFRIINVFTAPDTIEHREEYSIDKIHWYPMAQGYEKKLP
jgi:hypothetical protein